MNNIVNPVSILFGTSGLLGVGWYMAKSNKPMNTILVGALAGAISGVILGSAIYYFYTYDKKYYINTI